MIEARQPMVPQMRERGFTLIELLVSMTLLTMILGLLGIGLRVIARDWDKSVERIDQIDMISRAHEILRRDIHGLQRLISTSGSKPTFLFKGNQDGMTFVVVEPPFPTQPGLYFINYSVKSNGSNSDLVRARAQFQPKMISFPGATPANKVSLIQGPYRYRFAYSETSNLQRRWHDSWPFETRLPDLIRLQVSYASGTGTLLPPIIAAVKADAELSCLGAEIPFCSAKTGGELSTQSNKPRERATQKKQDESTERREGWNE